MPYPFSFSISGASLFLCVCIGLLAGDCRPARAEEGNTPRGRSPVVGGTAFPSLEHDKDAEAEVWNIRRPAPRDTTMDTSQPPLYVVPEIRLPRSGHADSPRPRQPGRKRP